MLIPLIGMFIMKNSEHLVVFLEVARWRSFAEAARRLDMPTTSLSRKIQQLEQQLSVKLFNRNTKSVSLTEVGERLVPKAELVLESLEELHNETLTSSTVPRGSIRLTAPRAVLGYIAPIVASFARTYPEVKLVVNSSNRYENLVEERYDFALRVGPLKDSSQAAIKLSPLCYVLVLQATLLVSIDTLTHPKQLEQLAAISNVIEGYHVPWRFEKQGERVEVELKQRVECDDLFLAAQMAMEGLGVAYLPYALVKEEVEKGLLVQLLPEWIPQNRELYLVYSHRENMPLKARLFIEHMKQHKGEIEHYLSQCQ